MRLTTDDRVWRFQGRLIELDEFEIPFHPRYVAIGIWLLLAPLLILILYPLGPLLGVFGSCVYAAILSWRLADFITGEVSLGAWLRILSSEWSARRRHRRHRLGGGSRATTLTLRAPSR